MGLNSTPALSVVLGESGVGTTLPMNAEPEKTFLFITRIFFYENFLTEGAADMTHRVNSSRAHSAPVRSNRKASIRTL
jgi:hypothetical protein